jgi:tRNA modification GTPase
MNAPAGDTIYALSSGRLPAAIAVVRMSGPRARIGLEMLAGKLPEPRRAAYAVIRNPASGEMIDGAIAIWIPGPKSETGEDMAEIHLHGGRALVAAVFQVLANIDGFRIADPGEFTRRALLNGKIDLTGVEALGDLIAAETEAQRRQAMHQFRGALARKAGEWRERLLDALALMEASIDFSDEGDVPQNLQTAATAAIRQIADEMDAALADANRGEKLREGFVAAIAGPANAGKSTLLNTLAKRDVAIVTDIPGTTRDQIEVSLDLKGVPVVLVDTAGIRATTDPIEAEGIRRALARAHEADLVLWLVDAEDHYPPAPPARAAKVITVRTKADRLAMDTRSSDPGISSGIPDGLSISAHTGEGMDRLIETLAAEAQKLAGEPALVTHARQRHWVSDAIRHLRSVIAANGKSEELIAEDIRQAAQAVGRITGRVGVDEVLDRIFKNFCIGK